MKDYDFTLKFALNRTGEELDAFVGRLGQEGCGDALVGIGQAGRIALDFTRSSESAHDALLSALRDVKNAAPDAKLIEAAPDLAGLSDIADILGFSRQNMRKLMLAHSATFPLPVHEGNPSIWHLSQVLEWLRERGYEIDAELIETASTCMHFNVANEMLKAPGIKNDVLALVA